MYVCMCVCVHACMYMYMVSPHKPHPFPLFCWSRWEWLCVAHDAQKELRLPGLFTFQLLASGPLDLPLAAFPLFHLSRPHGPGRLEKERSAQGETRNVETGKGEKWKRGSMEKWTKGQVESGEFTGFASATWKVEKSRGRARKGGKWQIQRFRAPNKWNVKHDIRRKDLDLNFKQAEYGTTAESSIVQSY